MIILFSILACMSTPGFIFVLLSSKLASSIFNIVLLFIRQNKSFEHSSLYEPHSNFDSVILKKCILIKNIAMKMAYEI